MRIIGVIDVLKQQAVAARAGLRESYAPIFSPLCEGSDPRAVAEAFADRCQIDEIYLADLDRLSGRPPNLAAWAAVAQVANHLWLDAGIRNADEYQRVVTQFADNSKTANCANATFICASESWNSTDFPEFSSGRSTHAFSLDLRHGELNSPIDRWRTMTILDVARELIDAGWSRFVVLDVAAVGVESGCPTMALCQQLRRLSDKLEIVTGGGIRDRNDLRRLEEAGCDAVLVSTALHKLQLP